MRLKPVAMTVTRTSSPIEGSVTMPGMTRASGSALSVMMLTISSYSVRAKSSPPRHVDEDVPGALDSRVLEEGIV